MPRCNKCKEDLAVELFKTKRLKGEIVACKACIPCNKKLAEATAKYQATDKGIAANAEWKKSEKATESNTEKTMHYRKTTAYRDHRDRVRGSAVTKARTKRGNDKRKTKPDQKLRSALQRRLNRLLKGARHNSAAVFANTEFASGEQVVEHFKSKLGPGMTIDNHGTVWDMEHTIACRWYDHNDEDDVKRCWSLANLRCMTGSDNWSKGIDIPDDATLYEIGVDHWPKAWNGQIPDRDKLREQFHKDRVAASMRAKGLA